MNNNPPTPNDEPTHSTEELIEWLRDSGDLLTLGVQAADSLQTLTDQLKAAGEALQSIVDGYDKEAWHGGHCKHVAQQALKAIENGENNGN